MTPEEIDQLENKLWSIIDAALYGGLDTEAAVFKLFQLFDEERKKIQLEHVNNKD